MKKFNLLIVVFACFMFSGCVVLTSKDAVNDEAALQGTPTATLKISRPGIFGFARTTPIYINGKYIARIGGGKTLVYHVKPGNLHIETSKFTLSLSNPVHKSLQFNARSGKTYEIEVTIPAQIDLLGPVTDLKYDLRLKS